MLKQWFLKIHGWVALVFAIPLAVLIVTGAILSVEPIVQVSGLHPGRLTTEKMLAFLKEHDPEGKARSLSHRAYEHSLSIEGAGKDGEVEIDLRNGKPFGDDESGWYWSDQFSMARRLHEHFTVANVELTVVSTYAMLFIILLGILMGLPRIRNSVAGWHKAAAWFLLPLLIASPLTGIFISTGTTLNFFASAPPPQAAAAPAAPRPAPQSLPLADAVRIAGEKIDFSNLIWLRQRGSRQLVRVWEGGEARVYVITKDGLKPADRNFSRLFHEGNFAGIWSGLMNVVISAALVLLTVTGLWLFGRKQLRKFQNRRARAQWDKAQPAE